MSTFNESKHNRQAAGTSIGGQFANKDHPANEEVTLGGTPWEGEQPTAYDLGLTELGVSSVFVTQEEDGTCTIEAQMDYSTAFHAQRYLAEAQGDEEGAQHFVVRALDEDFNKLVASRYPGATVAGTSDEMDPTIRVDAQFDPAGGIDAMADALWEQTPMVQIANESDPGTFGAKDFTAEVDRLVKIKGGGQYRDLQAYDSLQFPPHIDDEREARRQVVDDHASREGLSWEKVMGQGRRTPANIENYYQRAWEKLGENHEYRQEAFDYARAASEFRAYGRAYQQGVPIPADAEDAFERIWNGEGGGFSKDHFERELIETQELQRQLSNGSIRPSKLVGTGYRNSRKVAEEFLSDRLASTKLALQTRGRSNALNTSNVRLATIRRRSRLIEELIG